MGNISNILNASRIAIQNTKFLTDNDSTIMRLNQQITEILKSTTGLLNTDEIQALTNNERLVASKRLEIGLKIMLRNTREVEKELSEKTQLRDRLLANINDLNIEKAWTDESIDRSKKYLEEVRDWLRAASIEQSQVMKRLNAAKEQEKKLNQTLSELNTQLESRKNEFDAKIKNKKAELEKIKEQIEFVTKSSPMKFSEKSELTIRKSDFMEFRENYDMAGDMKRLFQQIFEEYWTSPVDQGGMSSFDQSTCYAELLDVSLNTLSHNYSDAIKHNNPRLVLPNDGGGSLLPVIQHFGLLLSHADYHVRKYPREFLAFIRHAFVDFLVDDLLDQPIWKSMYENPSTSLNDILSLMFEADGIEAISMYKYLAFISLWSYKVNRESIYSTVGQLREKTQTRFNDIVAEAKLANFENNDVEVDSTDSIITNIDGLSGLNFESLLEKLFIAMGYLVNRTKKSGDQGADLILKKDGEKTVVQAKRYTNTVGNKAVQEVLASREYYSASNAIVVTSSAFTISARELANASRVQLWDRKQLEIYIRRFL